jgi:hypothetical protein
LLLVQRGTSHSDLRWVRRKGPLGPSVHYVPWTGWLLFGVRRPTHGKYDVLHMQGIGNGNVNLLALRRLRTSS